MESPKLQLDYRTTQHLKKDEQAVKFKTLGDSAQ